MSRNRIHQIVIGCAVLMLAAGLFPASAVGATALKHAVVCPPFKGDSELAALYHKNMVEMLKKADGVEYLEGVKALARRAPKYTYRVIGSIETDGQRPEGTGGLPCRSGIGYQIRCESVEESHEGGHRTAHIKTTV